MRHPDDEEQFGSISAPHRAECAPRRREQERFESALTGFQEFVRGASERPESFWERQRLAVRARLRPARPSPGLRTVWTLASATTLLVLALIFVPKHNQPVRADFAAGDDQELLVGIERLLNRDAPQALQPVLIITEQLEDAAAQSLKRRGNP
jgi:hypothetical protein